MGGVKVFFAFVGGAACCGGGGVWVGDVVGGVVVVDLNMRS